MDKKNSFEITIRNDQVNELEARLSLTCWPVRQTVDDWSQGVPLHYVQEIVDYWLHHYDHWRLARRLNQ